MFKSFLATWDLVGAFCKGTLLEVNFSFTGIVQVLLSLQKTRRACILLLLGI